MCGDKYMYVDDFCMPELYVPDCVAPTNLSVSGVTTTSATLNWVSDGSAFMIEIQGSGVPQGTQGAGGYVIGDVTPYTSTSVSLLDPLTGEGVLTSNTSYDFYVVNVCDYSADGVNPIVVNEQSEYAGPFTFTTPCDTVTVFPYSEEFESITTGQPDCWSIQGTTTTASYDFNSYTSGYSGRGMRFNSYYNPTGNTSELISPIFDTSSLPSIELKFYYKNPTAGDLDILVSNDGGSTFTNVGNFSSGQSDWVQKTINLTDYIRL